MDITTYGAVIDGIRARYVRVTATHQPGAFTYLSTITGMPEREGDEMKARLRAMARARGIDREGYAVTFTPEVKRARCALDLAAAVALLAHAVLVPKDRLAGWMFFGEVGLDSTVRQVSGAVAASVLAAELGLKLMVCSDSCDEAAFVQGSQVFAANTISEALYCLGMTEEELAKRQVLYYGAARRAQPTVDLGMIRGNHRARRALEIAAAGGHGLMFVGPPGTGKTLLARAMPGILPPMTYEERLEVTMVHSAAGLARGAARQRPFRAPHHTASEGALVGSGGLMGEVSLAHRGVLFLDEAAEFRRASLEALRESCLYGEAPQGKVTYPAKYQLVLSVDRCPCGHLGDPHHACRCTPQQIELYRRRLDTGLVDRCVYLFAETESVNATTAPAGESSEVVQARVVAARAILAASPSDSGFSRELLVARTIAALAGSTTPTEEHVAEARSFCTNPFIGEK